MPGAHAQSSRIADGRPRVGWWQPPTPGSRRPGSPPSWNGARHRRQADPDGVRYQRRHPIHHVLVGWVVSVLVLPILIVAIGSMDSVELGPWFRDAVQEIRLVPER